MLSNRTALITGASSGIGYEIAFIHARHGDNLVLIARSADKLENLKTELESSYGIKVLNIKADLTIPLEAEKIYRQLKESEINIDFLINNAGFGLYGKFHELEWTRQEAMINLNIVTLAHFCRLFIPDMLARGQGKIMNIASTASFLPGPGMAVYYASKAFVLHFSEALQYELRNSGVTVTALCPGPTISNFQEVASVQDSRLVKGKKLPTSKEVAEYGYKAMMNGKTVAVHGLMNKLITFGVRLNPRKLNTAIAAFVQGKD